MAAKKVLILTYYWPPSGGAGVQRWMRFVNHLRASGWEPVVYTAENPLYPILDEQLLDRVPQDIRVIKTPIIEPHGVVKKFKRLLGQTKNGDATQNEFSGDRKSSALDRLLWTIRGNYFIPDARFLWIKPSVKYLTRLLQEESFDALVSTGPPHSMHVIAARVKEKTGIPWVADFRDPWTSIDFYQDLNLSQRADRKHHQLEERVVREADRVVVVGGAMAQEFQAKYQVSCDLIFNGYEESGERVPDVAPDEKFSIVHIGSFTSQRNCPDLWRVLAEEVQQSPEFAERLQIKLVGNTDPTILQSIQEVSLTPWLTTIPYVPFTETQKHLYAAQLLLLPIDRVPSAPMILTGKLFEYLKSHRPVLLLAPPEGDAARVVRDCQAGYIVDFNHTQELREAVLQTFEDYKSGQASIQPHGVEAYSSRHLTQKLAEILNEITS